MGTVYWRGNAASVAQVDTLTPVADNSATYTATIGSKTVTYTADSSTSVAEITAGLVAAWNASTEPEFQEITATDSTTHVTLTADTAGKPFTVSGSATGSGQLNQATTTANSGPNDWSVAKNWDTGAVPVDGDDVVIGPGSVSILYGLSQSGIDLTSLTISASYTGTIGLPDYNGRYREYRTTYLTLGTATTVDVGLGDGPGSGRIRLHLGTNAATVRVWRLGSSQDQGLPALQLQGSNASNALHVYQGTVGLAANPGETANFPTINVGFTNSQATDASIKGGAGLSAVTTVTQSGGVVDLTSNVTTWHLRGGEAWLRGTATLTTMNADEGTFYDASSGTLTTLNVGSDVVYDRSKDLRSKTVSNCYAGDGATILDPFKTITWTNGINLYRSGILSARRSKGVALDLGEHLRLTPGAYS